MRKPVTMLVAILLASGIWSATAQLRLGKGPEGEPARQTYDERFSISNALTCTQQINMALQSFTTLTRLAKPKLTAAQVRKVGNADPETQELGFVNWVGAVEGTLRKQHYQIAKLELDIARINAASGKLSKQQLLKKQAACSKAEKDFQRFWNSFSIAD